MNPRFPIAAIATLLLAACASGPSRPLLHPPALTPHDAAASDHDGTPVRWGGRIIRTEPRSDRTCFEMISASLDHAGRPHWTNDTTWGRFIACRPGFYDPALFQPNRDVTFDGRIDGFEERRLDGHVYRFPRVAADEVRLWPPVNPPVRKRKSGLW